VPGASLTRPPAGNPERTEVTHGSYSRSLRFARHARHANVAFASSAVEDEPSDHEPMAPVMIRQIIGAATTERAHLIRQVWHKRRGAYRVDNEGAIPTLIGGKIFAVDKTCPAYPMLIVIYDRLVAVSGTLVVLAYPPGEEEPILVRLPHPTVEEAGA